MSSQRRKKNYYRDNKDHKKIFNEKEEGILSLSIEERGKRLQISFSPEKHIFPIWGYN